MRSPLCELCRSARADGGIHFLQHTASANKAKIGLDVPDSQTHTHTAPRKCNERTYLIMHCPKDIDLLKVQHCNNGTEHSESHGFAQRNRYPRSHTHTHRTDNLQCILLTFCCFFFSVRSPFPFQCVPILGRGYETGGYKCECLQGFEYPYEDLITYYDGQLVEAEFENIVNDKESRFETFKCRLAGAAALQVQFTIVVFVSLFGWILLRRNLQC